MAAGKNRWFARFIEACAILLFAGALSPVQAQTRAFFPEFPEGKLTVGTEGTNSLPLTVEYRSDNCLAAELLLQYKPDGESEWTNMSLWDDNGIHKENPVIADDGCGEVTVTWDTLLDLDELTSPVLVDIRTTIQLASGEGQLALDADTQEELALIIPPDPSEVAPPLSGNGPSVSTFEDSVEFLYTGEDSIQKDVDTEEIDPIRIGVIRGMVMDRNGDPLPGVKVSIHGHPEFGYTHTRLDGWYDMAMNGGGRLAVNFERNGFLPAHREVDTFWREFVFTTDLVMLPVDEQKTVVSFDNPTSVQIARGSLQSDDDGQRQTTAIFPSGVSAVLSKDGYTTPTTSLTIRATEFTVGELGLEQMPAEMAPNTDYTFCVELSADEALAIDADSVIFSDSVPIYVENFLDFPVGELVPNGFYDRQEAVWVPLDNGRIVEVIDIVSGRAILNVSDPDADTAATQQELDDLGITNEELDALATIYAIGTELTRWQVPHFTTCDPNYPVVPPVDVPNGVSTNAVSETKQNNVPDSCGADNLGFLDYQNREFREALSISSTPYSLCYSSDLVDGQLKNSSIVIPLQANDMSYVDYVRVEVRIAGKRYVNSYPSTQSEAIFTWDGEDAYGRRVYGNQKAVIELRFYYDVIPDYLQPNATERSFTVLPLAGPISYYDAGIEKTVGGRFKYWQAQADYIRYMNYGNLSDNLDVGGWSFNVHHAYNTNNNTLYLGDGTKRQAGSLGAVVKCIVGLHDGIIDYLYEQENFPVDAETVNISDAKYLAVRPDGNVVFATYFAGPYEWDRQENKFYRLLEYDVDYDGDILALAVGQNNDTYFSLVGDSSLDDGLYRLRNGNITLLSDFASTAWIEGIVVGPSGVIYFSDVDTSSVYQITTSGDMIRVAGSGVYGFSGDGGSAIDAKLRVPKGLALDSKGRLYICDLANYRIRRVEKGKIETIAGTGSSLYFGDGAPAVEAGVYPESIAVDRRGFIYVCESRNRIRVISPDGTIQTLVGNGNSGSNLSYLESRWASSPVYSPSRISMGPDQDLYYTDGFWSSLNKVESSFPGFEDGQIIIPSESNSLLYYFDKTGKHLSTKDALLGNELLTFDYDSDNRLVSIENINGLITTINRSQYGTPINIVAPYDQITTVTLNGNGYLAGITNAEGETITLEYDQTTPARLVSVSSPQDDEYVVSYDTYGHATMATDPEGGEHAITSFDELEENDERFLGTQVTVDTPENRSSTYKIEYLKTNETRRTTVAADDRTTTSTSNNSDTSVVEYPDGTVVTSTTTGKDSASIHPNELVTTTITTTIPYDDPDDDDEITLVYTVESDMDKEDPDDPFSQVTYVETITELNESFTTVNEWTYNAQNGTSTSVSTSPAARKTEVQYDNQGRAVRSFIRDSSNDPYFNPTFMSYDSDGRPEKIIVGASETDTNRREISFEYYTTGDNKGYLHKIKDPLERYTEFEYDKAGRVTKTILPDSREITRTYDDNGNLETLTPPDHPAHTFGYNSLDMPISYTPPDIPPLETEPSTTTTYNLDRQPITATRADGSSLHLTYGQDEGCACSDARLSLITQDAGYLTVTYAERSSNVGTITVSEALPASLTTGDSITVLLDSPGTSFNGKQTVTSFSSGSKTITFSSAGTDFSLNPVTGNAIVHDESVVYEYFDSTDPETEAKIETISALGGKERLVFGYTGALNTSVEAQSDNTDRVDGKISWTFDDFMRVDTLTLLDDSGGDELTISFDRDNDNLLTSITDDAGPTTLVDITRDGDTGLVENVTTGNLIDDRIFNDFGELEEYSIEFDDGVISGTPYAVEFTYDKLGRITQKVETVLINNADHATSSTTQTYWEYDYDDADRLWKVTKDSTVVEEYEYDDNGNRTLFKKDGSNKQTDFVVNDQDQLVQYLDEGTTITLTYNDNGEMISKEIYGGELTEYEYDVFGQLVKVTLDSGGQDESEIEYLYDPIRRRVGKLVNGNLKRQWLYNSPVYPAVELDDSGDVLAYFLSANIMIRPVGTADAGTYTLVRDYLGSVRLVIDNDTGEILQKLEYDTYGNVTIDTNPGFQPLGYAGGIYDSDTGLIKFGLREYASEIGCWIRKDPIGFAGGLNFYAYVAGNPIMYKDVLGLYFDLNEWDDQDPIIKERIQMILDFMYNYSGVLDDYGPPGFGADFRNWYESPNSIEIEDLDGMSPIRLWNPGGACYPGTEPTIAPNTLKSNGGGDSGFWYRYLEVLIHELGHYGGYHHSDDAGEIPLNGFIDEVLGGYDDIISTDPLKATWEGIEELNSKAPPIGVKTDGDGNMYYRHGGGKKWNPVMPAFDGKLFP